MRTCSCFRVTTLLPLLSLALTAVGWTVFNVTEKVVCKFFPLILSDSCDDSHSLAMRAITLGRSADSSCAAASFLDLLDSSVRDRCCRHRPEDGSVTYHLPSDRDNLPFPYKELVEKCFQTPDHCDMFGIPGVNIGRIPEGLIPNQGPLSYVAVSYSCIPTDATLSFTEVRPVTAPVVSLRLDENTPVSSQCLIYSHSCDVTIRLGIIDVNVHDPCTLTLDDGNAGTESCSRLQTQPQPLLQSSSNAVAVSLHFNGSGVDRQRLWLEAEGSDKSPITVVCGPSAPAPASVRCTPATTSSTIPAPTKTAAPTNAPTKTAAPTNAPINTAAPTNAPTDTAAPTNAPINTAAPTNAPTKTAAPTNAPTNTAAPTNAPINTAAPNIAPITPLHSDTPAGTARETSTNVHSGTTTVAAEQTTHAVDWTAFSVTEEVVCKFSPLTLSGVCDDSHSLVLRAITLGRSADSFCAEVTLLQLRQHSVREKCCHHRPEDGSVTYPLPWDRDHLPFPYKDLVDKCLETPDRCDLYGIRGVLSGLVPDRIIPNQGPLTYVAVSYSCIPKDATLSFTEDRPVTAPVVSLRLDENTPVSSQCLIYSHSCDVTIKLRIIDVNVSDPCALTWDDGNAGVESCSRLQTQPQPLLQSSSNAVAVSLHFNGSGVDRQRLWLEAEGSDKSPITVACGTSAPTPASVRCTPATTSSTTTAPTNTAVPNTAATGPMPSSTPAGTTRETTHAVDWTAFSVTEEVVCKFSPLTLSGVCDDSHSLVLRAITLGRSADSFCAEVTLLQLRQHSVREKCCHHRPEDGSVTYHLPWDRDHLPFPYKDLVDKCLETPDRCDLYGIRGVLSGLVPDRVIPNQGPLTYVAVSYSCIPNTPVTSAGEGPHQ